MTNDEIAYLLKKDPDQLFEMLGMESGKFAAPTDLIARGKEIYENLKQKLRSVICDSETIYHNWLERPVDSKHFIISQLIDCISGYVVGVTPATVCVLLYKEGLPSFCADRWGQKFGYKSGGGNNGCK
jgi:hypothetical protein